MEQGAHAGLTELANRLAKVGLKILEHGRLRPHILATGITIGKPDQHTRIVLSDEFLSDLPNTREYQAAVDSYVSAVAGRIRCGSPYTFYCLSNRGVRVEIQWPIQAGLSGSTFWSDMFVDVTDEATSLIAKCAVSLGRLRFSKGSQLDDIRLLINRIRNAVDHNVITFYDPRNHPETFQKITPDLSESGAPRWSHQLI